MKILIWIGKAFIIIFAITGLFLSVQITGCLQAIGAFN